MSAAELIIRFLVLVLVVPMLFWSQLMMDEVRAKSGVPLPDVNDSNRTENAAYDPRVRL